MGGFENLIGRLLRPVRAGEKHLACRDPAARDALEAITVGSPAFASGGAMPQRYAGQGVGDNVSPPLDWSDVPAAAQELVLIVEDRVGAAARVRWSTCSCAASRPTPPGFRRAP